MPDLLNFTVTQQGSGQSRTWRISCQVIDSSSGAVIEDLTGGKAILFPQAFLALSDKDQEEFMRRNADWLLAKQLGWPV